jgi:hypothetical protein
LNSELVQREFWSGAMASVLTLNAIGRAQASQRVIIGRAKHGSRRRLQDYVNGNCERLSVAIRASLPELASSSGHGIRWVSPLARNNYVEYRDAGFLRAVGLGMYAAELASFWPKPSPSWDALAIISLEGDASGVLLVEGKSHPAEIYVSGCKAEGSTRGKIEKALANAKQWCGVAAETEWMGSIYEYARRIAHLYFLREVLKHQAWLVNVFFLNDPIGRADRPVWEHELSQARAALGLTAPLRYAIDVFLPTL